MALNPKATERERDEAPDADLADGRGTDWARFADAIDSLLSTGEYGWALATLKGIQATVLRTERVTPAQRRAFWAIEAGNRWRGRRR
jgi:hypothetical protein